MKSGKKPDIKQVLAKMQHICSVREKCRHDIHEKLRLTGLSPGESDEIIRKLEADKFIDDSRYADYFTRDKLRFNRWGRLKIRHALQQKKIASDIIDGALTSIDEEEYLSLMKEEALKKNKSIHEPDKYRRKAKLMQFLASRGLEPEYIYDIADTVLKD